MKLKKKSAQLTKDAQPAWAQLSEDERKVCSLPPVKSDQADRPCFWRSQVYLDKATLTGQSEGEAVADE